jgi:hypothetical protein
MARRRITRGSEILLTGLALGAAVLGSARSSPAQSAPSQPAPPPQAPLAGAPAAEPLGQRIAVAGAVLFGATYLSSVVAAGTMLIADSTGNRGVKPLFIPVAGPFATLSNAHGSGPVLLVLDGVSQVAGLVMVVVGIAMTPAPPASPSKVAHRATPLLAPEVSLGARSAALRWHF